MLVRTSVHVCVCVCVCACVHVSACVCACVHACVNSLYGQDFALYKYDDYLPRFTTVCLLQPDCAGMLNNVSMLSYWMNYGNISYDYMEQFLANQHTSPQIKRSEFSKRITPDWYMPEHIRTPSLRTMDKPDNFGDAELFSRYEKTLLDPYFAPLMATDEQLKGMPPAYVLTAGYDVLRDDGLIYARRLRSVEVPVKLAHYTEGFHGMIFFLDGPIPFDVGRRAMSDLVEYLKENV